MEKKNIVNRDSTVISCAIFTAGLVQRDIRAKDILFYIDLMGDMFQTDQFGRTIEVQTVQILRMLDKFIAWGWAQKKTEAAKPTYEVTPEGYLELLKSFTDKDVQLPINEALFIQSYLDSYAGIIEDYIKSLGLSGESYAKLEKYLSPKYVLVNQLKLVERAIRDFERRVALNLELSKFVKSSQDQGRSMEEIIKEMPSEFSYQLSYRMPFKEWLGAMPIKLATHELTDGISVRQKNFYQPILKVLHSQKSFYQNLIGE